jgi:hypothetical protein
VVFGTSKSIVFFSATTFLFAAATASLSWCWVYGLGGAIREVNIMILFTALVGWLVALWKFKNGTSATADDERVKYRLADLAILLAIIGATLFVGLFPKMDTPTTLTMAFRTGPDAIGLANSVDGLLRDGSFGNLKTKIVQSSINQIPIEEIMDTREKSVYQIPSLSASIKAEWLIGPSRWGLAGINANILSLIGLKYLWATIAILPSLSVLFGALFMFETLRELKVGKWLSCLSVVGAICNVNLVHAWHEGGLSQSFVFASSAFIVFGLLNPKMTISHRFILGLAATIVVLPSYPDLIILLALLCLSLVFVALKLRRFQFALQYGLTACVSLVAGSALSGPYFFRFAIGVSRRIKEAGVGGWSQPVWTGLSENLGLFNPYNIYPNFGHPGFSEFVVIALDAAVLGFLVQRLRIRLPSNPSLVLICISTVVMFFYLKTRYIDHSTNYTYFKVVGMLSPFLLALFSNMAGSSRVTKRDQRILALFCVLSITACSNYVFHYRDTSIRLSNSIPADLIQASKDQGIKNYDVIVSNYSTEIASFVSFIDLRLINRNQSLLVDLAEKHPVAILIERRDCPKWKCVSGVSERNFKILTPKFALLLLNVDSSMLVKPGPTDYGFIAQIISDASLLVNGPIFNGSLQPISR